MTIDYKALAERVERLGNAYEHLADAAYIVEEVLGRWASATGGNTTEIRMAVSLLEGMAQEKPVGYVAANGLRMLKQEDATVLLYAHDYLIQPDCVALYMHPAPAVPQAEPKREPLSDERIAEIQRAAYERAAQKCEAIAKELLDADAKCGGLTKNGRLLYQGMWGGSKNCADAIRALGRK